MKSERCFPRTQVGHRWPPVFLAAWPGTIVAMICLTISLVACVAFVQAAEKPPYHGTIFIAPMVITAEDPTAFQQLEGRGAGSRKMFDRRANDWIQREAWLFHATFDDGLAIEVQVNPEFNQQTARRLAERYLPSVGRLPKILRKDVQSIWIHDGEQPFGGGNQNLLIHVGMAESYLRDGILEETLCHEAAHTSLDAEHASAPGWTQAQTADRRSISTYAQDNPQREDIAESFLPYMAVRYRRDRLPESIRMTVEQTIPHRLKYFDSLRAEMHPFAR